MSEYNKLSQFVNSEFFGSGQSTKNLIKAFQLQQSQLVDKFRMLLTHWISKI